MKHLLIEGVDIYYAPIPDDRGLSRHSRETSVVNSILMKAAEGCTLSHEPSGAPVLTGFDGYISITHSRLTAAVGFCAEAPIGIDVEGFRTQLRNVARRVFSDEELKRIGDDPALLLEGWTIKEAVYKAAGIPGLRFREDIILPAGEGKPAHASGKVFSIRTATLPTGETLAVAREVSPLSGL